MRGTSSTGKGSIMLRSGGGRSPQECCCTGVRTVWGWFRVTGTGCISVFHCIRTQVCVPCSEPIFGRAQPRHGVVRRPRPWATQHSGSPAAMQSLDQVAHRPGNLANRQPSTYTYEWSCTETTTQPRDHASQRPNSVPVHAAFVEAVHYTHAPQGEVVRHSTLPMALRPYQRVCTASKAPVEEASRLAREWSWPTSELPTRQAPAGTHRHGEKRLKYRRDGRLTVPSRAAEGRRRATTEAAGEAGEAVNTTATTSADVTGNAPTDRTTLMPKSTTAQVGHSLKCPALGPRQETPR